MASSVQLCHMTAKRWANVFAGGACGRTSHASRGGRTVYNFGFNVLLLWSCLNPIIKEHLSSQLGFACIRARASAQDFVSRNWVRAVTWQLSLISPNCQLLFAYLCRRSFQNQFCSSVWRCLKQISANKPQRMSISKSFSENPGPTHRWAFLAA